MSADVLLLPRRGAVADAPPTGTALVAETAGGWQVTLRGYSWGIRVTVPRYGAGRGRGAEDGMAAAEEIAEAHGLGIHWHQFGPRTLIATGVFTRG